MESHISARLESCEATVVESLLLLEADFINHPLTSPVNLSDFANVHSVLEDYYLLLEFFLLRFDGDDLVSIN